MSRFVVLSTGGTGGHVFPAQALAGELSARGYRLALITDKRGGAYRGPLGELETHLISAAGVSGRGTMARVGAALRLGIGYFQARSLLGRLKPDAIVGFGGYASVPTMMAASHLRVKSVIHEQNAVLGRANRLLAPRVAKIALSFEKTSEVRDVDRPKAVWTGNPVRPQIAALTRRTYREPGSEGPVNILITGGSQGASIFGEVVPGALARLPDEIRTRVSVFQQVRENQLEDVRQAYGNAGIDADVRTFFNDMPELLGKAHLMIARSGASTVAEVGTAALPSILVPYPHAVDDHQSANAARICDAGGAWMIPQDAFNIDALSSRIGELLAKPALLKAASSALSRVAMPDATQRLARLVVELIEAGSASGNGTTSEKTESHR